MNVQRSYLHEHRYLQSRYGQRPWFTTIETDSGALATDDNFSLRNFPNQLQMACMPACCSTKHARNSLILRSHDISLGARANYKAMRVGDVIRTSCFDEDLLLLGTRNDDIGCLAKAALDHIKCRDIASNGLLPAMQP